MHKHRHTGVHIQARTHKHKCTHTYAQVCAHMHKLGHTCPYMRVHTHKHTHKYMHTQACTHTPQHAHRCSPSQGGQGILRMPLSPSRSHISLTSCSSTRLPTPREPGQWSLSISRCVLFILQAAGPGSQEQGLRCWVECGSLGQPVLMERFLNARCASR